MIPIMRCGGHIVYCYRQRRLPVHIKNPLIERRRGQLGCDVLIFTRHGIIARGRVCAWRARRCTAVYLQGVRKKQNDNESNKRTMTQATLLWNEPSVSFVFVKFSLQFYCKGVCRSNVTKIHAVKLAHFWLRRWPLASQNITRRRI